MKYTIKIKKCLGLLVLSVSLAPGAVTVTNFGTTTPTGFAIGNTVLDPHSSVSGLPEIFGFRQGNTYGQSFTIASAGSQLDSIMIGYGSLTGAATATDFSLTIDLGNDGGTVDLTETFTLTTASITQEAAAPYSGIHWLELDVSSSALALGVGTHSFLLTADSITGATNSWLLAPSYTLTNEYGGGNTIGSPVANTGDTNFAITTSPIPEPSSLVLLSLGGLALLNRRRA